jgi:hypothetical protein
MVRLLVEPIPMVRLLVFLFHPHCLRYLAHSSAFSEETRLGFQRRVARPLAAFEGLLRNIDKLLVANLYIVSLSLISH